MQLQAHPTDIFFTGQKSAAIKYNPAKSQWILEDSLYNITAVTNASHMSFALGKHNWTVSGDTTECSQHQSSYTVEMKLTGCKAGEFTCNDGQCISMEERCNQLVDCRDESDEMGCEILILKNGYKKRVPPITATAKNTVRPVSVSVSIALLKVVAIEEEDHAIQLEFQIVLEWMENRATYHNLKKETYLNALSMEDINRLWLPLVIYTNTDQQETTRLGVEWEWRTKVLVQREGELQRSGNEVLHETEIFRGDENSLSMMQSYTHEFQCVYHLTMYPFDTQVNASCFDQ